MPAMMEYGSNEVSVVVYQEIDCQTGAIAWIAQCLEYDIASQGRTSIQAQERLERNLIATLYVFLENGEEPFTGISAAPQRYWNMFRDARSFMSWVV